MKSWVAAVTLILLSSTHCLSAELDIRKALLDKKLVDQINWSRANSYFSGKPISSKVYDKYDSRYDTYNPITLGGVELTLNLLTNTKENIKQISLSLPEHKEGEQSYCDNNDVDSILDTLTKLYGDNYKLYLSKLALTDNVHFVLKKYQWSANNTRINYDVTGSVKTDGAKCVAASITYGSVASLKLYEPVKFIECSVTAIYADGDQRKSNDLTLGIDYNTGKIVTDGYFESTFVIDGDFITSKKEHDGATSIIKINRSSGKLTGTYKAKNNFTATYSGTCTIQSDKKMF